MGGHASPSVSTPCIPPPHAATPLLSLITRGPILPTYPSYARTAVLPLAKAAGVDVLEGDGVARVEAGAVVLEGGGRVAADEVLLCTQAAAAGWLKATGLPLGALQGEATRLLLTHSAAIAGISASPVGVVRCVHRPLASSAVCTPCVFLYGSMHGECHLSQHTPLRRRARVCGD